jgi:ferredoxin-NADP reductase
MEDAGAPSVNIVPRPDHLERTADEPRAVSYVPAEVIGLRTLSPSVRGIRLRRTGGMSTGSLTSAPSSRHPPDVGFGYRAGQWLDVRIEGVPVVGGFSATSSPLCSAALREACNVAEPDAIDLAVKHSKHPPAAWAHNTCKIGDLVNVRTGGKFTLDPIVCTDSSGRVSIRDAVRRIVFVAGGVGINPLYSMLLELAAISESRESLTTPPFPQIYFAFSAREEAELLFERQLRWLAGPSSALHGCLHLHLSTTRSHEHGETHDGGRDSSIDRVAGSGSSGMRTSANWDAARTYHGRVSHALLHEAVLRGTHDNTGTYMFICGPPRMTDEFTAFATDTSESGLGLPEAHMYCERWW